MRNRTDEYWELVNELSQPPESLAGSVDRARRRAKRSGLVRCLAAPAASFAAVAATFVLLVNTFPAFALACSGVPIIRELTAAVAFSPSLSAAVAHDYVQYIGQSQTVDGVTLHLEYAIVDRRQAVFFYSADEGRFWIDPTITAPDGEGIGGYTKNDFYTNGENGLKTMVLSFTGGESSLPDRFTLEMSFHPYPKQDQISQPVAPSAPAPENSSDSMNPDDDPNGLRFAFDVTLDPARISNGRTVEVGQWLELDGQRFLVDRLEFFPTRTILYLGEDSANTAWLKSLKFSFVDGRGRVYDDIDGSLSASGEAESESYLTYYFQSFYYDQPEHLTLHITKAEWLDKDAPRVVLDLTTGEASNLPDGIRIHSVTPGSDGRTTVVKILSPLELSGLGQTFSQYWDPKGGAHSFRTWSGGTEYDDENRQIGSYELLYFKDYPWETVELKLAYTGMSVYEEPVSIPLF